MTKKTNKPAAPKQLPVVDRKSAAAGEKTTPGPVPPAVVAAGTRPSLVPPAAPKPKPENKRITAGAEVKEWRVVRSLRESQPGYFLQGGHFKKTSRGNSFIMGEEIHFVELKKAKEALAAKVGGPPSAAAAPAPAPRSIPRGVQ